MTQRAPQSKSSDKSEHSKRVTRLAARLLDLNSLQLDEVEHFVAKLEANKAALRAIRRGVDKSRNTIDWPHAPVHRLSGKGTFIVTAGTYQREHFFRDADRLNYLQ